MKTEHKSINFQLKDLDEGEGSGGFSGLGACANNIDGVGDIIAPGAFAGALAKFLSDGFIGGLNHDWKAPIGHPVEAYETPQGLFIRAVFDDTPDAQAVRAKMRINPASGRATVRKLSIGYEVVPGGAALLDGPEAIAAYWKSAGYTPSADDLAAAQQWGRVRLLKRLSLHEVSPVVVPANARATVSGVKSEGATGPEPRPAFKDHSHALVSEVGVYADRAESRLRARAKAGRELSSSNWSEIDAVRNALATGVERLAAILDRTQPGGAGKSEAEPEVKAEEAAASPAPETPAEPVPSPESEVEAKAVRVDPALVRSLFTRYLDAKRAELLPARSER